jgi:MFS family permease
VLVVATVHYSAVNMDQSKCMPADGKGTGKLTYLDELRQNWRPLAAACAGVGGGLNILAYAISVTAPHLVKEFGWSKSQFALVGLTMFTTLIVLPVVGRMTDIFGVKATATLGVLLTPIAIYAYSLMQGPFYQYLLISIGGLAVGSFATPVVYTRLIAANFHRARGLALTIMTCTPALIAAIGVPFLSDFVDAHGWRSGYRVLALFTFVLGCLSFLLIASGRRDDGARQKTTGSAAPKGLAVYRRITSSTTFWIITVGTFLCTLQTPLHSSQLNLMLLDDHITIAMAARMVSVYAVGTIIGRLACGLALDKFPTYLVAAISMALPTIGYAVLASRLDTVPAIAVAMFLIGLTVGAEGDLMPYLVARYFGLDMYSTVMSLVYCALFAASSTGALALSLTLKLTDHFSFFLWVISFVMLSGSLLLLRLRGIPAADNLRPTSRQIRLSSDNSR